MTGVGHVAVIGGGIAGVSAAYFLTQSPAVDRVTLVEAEAQLAHHTTGRSAALLIENYGEGPVRPLTTASLDFFHDPPDALVDAPLIERRGILTVATSRADDRTVEALLRAGAQTTNPVVEIDLDQASELAPHMVLSPEHRMIWEAHSFDIDVAALHQAFVRGAKAAGAEIHTARRADAAIPSGAGWLVETTAGDLEADVIINAAGAWGDVVAQRAGVDPVGLEPLKRTAFMVTSPFADSARYPCVAEIHHDWYLRPDGSQFMCSPADETPSEPCDARADEVDIAWTIDKLNEHTRLGIRSVNSHWAGLRTFGPDRAMVLGPEPEQPNFVWCVGQGGTGIQTAPGAGRLVADLASTGAAGDHFASTDLDLDALLPDRVR